MRFSPLCVAVIFGASHWAVADAPEKLDVQFRYGHVHASFLVNEDGTSVETHDWAMTVLKEPAIEWGKSTSISYSTSAQTAEVIAAYTQKADGRHIDVPKENYQVQSNQGKGKDAPAFSDITTMTVVFPDVAVGDTVAFSYRLIQTEPLFPGHFSIAHDYPNQVAFDDIQVRIDYPAALWVQFEVRGMKEKERSETDGRKILEWTYANPDPVKTERRNFSVYDSSKEVGFSFSTFKSYAEIAAAYGTRAQPKAAVTERVTALAAEIVKGKTTPRAQAQALYEWVARNITYGGNCIGIGAVVPRDLPVILDNKMGDCKDHATLLQALLTARGIHSTQALVNAGSLYRLPKVPVVATVNHVINYLPAFDLYVDSTSDATPFGMLPFQVADKPTLLVEGFKEGMRTPPTAIGSNQQTSKSKLTVAKDGSITGVIEIFQKGYGAAQTRAWARGLTKDAETDFVKNVFMGQGMIAKGKLEKDDPTPLEDTYNFKVNLTIEKFIKLPGPGAFYIFPLMNGGSSIQNMLASTLETETEDDVACSNGAVSEDYSIELPKSVKIISIPNGLKVANKFITYKSVYKRKGNIITVKRELNDKTKGNICSPQIAAESKKIAEKILDDLKSQVLYK